MKRGPREQPPHRGLALGKLLLGLFFLMRLLITCLLLSYPVMRSKAPVIHPPFSVFVYENKIRRGGLRAETLSPSCERQEYEAAFGLWEYVIHIFKKRQRAICCVFSFHPPCLGLRTRKQIILAHHWDTLF